MKYFLLSPDANGNTDPTVLHSLIDHLPGRVDNIASADCVLVLISWLPGYKFNEALLGIKKPVVIMDYLEHGWDAGSKPNLIGVGNLRHFGHLASDEWARLDSWLGTVKLALYFKRELFKTDAGVRTLPIEYPCRLEIPPVQSEAEFNARPIEVFFNWGLSNPARQRLHGDIFLSAHANGIHVVDSWEQDDHFEKRTWATIHSPHYLRKPIEHVMRWQQRAKVSVSLPGAGIKCFRSAEAPFGSIMALQDDGMAWSFPWTDNINCLRIQPSHEFETLLLGMERGELYGIYRISQTTIARYTPRRYAYEYVLPAIKERL